MVLVVKVNLIRVIWVELGVQVGLDDVGIVGNTDKAEKVETDVASKARVRGGRCGL